MGPTVGLVSLLRPSPDLIVAWPCVDQLLSDADLKLSGALSAAQLVASATADALGSSIQAKADSWAPALPAPSFKSSGACPLGFSNPAVYKQYPVVHLPCTWSLLTPKQLLWLYLKNSGIVLLLQVCNACTRLLLQLVY